MTVYLWIHWFWITYAVLHIGGSALTTQRHSNVTAPPAGESNMTQKLTTSIPSVEKLRKSTTEKAEEVSTTIISITNGTEPPVPVNVTYPEAVNATETLLPNITDLLYNQTYVQNTERFSIELEEPLEVCGNLSAAGITSITLGCVVIVGIVCGISYFLYRNRGFNRPQVLNDRCSNPDSSGYIDDASVRDNSEEMYSLDNDSFLNSLEAMTIQNYWTDTVKHTKL